MSCFKGEPTDAKVNESTLPSSKPQTEVKMNKFRKKPVVIEAIQFVEISRTKRKFGESVEYNDATIANFMGCSQLHMPTSPSDKPEGRTYLEIPTLEGVMQANVGDWIIKGVNGEFYPCKPDIFAKTYDVVEVGEDMGFDQALDAIKAGKRHCGQLAYHCK